MAKHYNGALTGTVSTEAHWREWLVAIDAALVAVGMVRVTISGEIDLDTVARPGTINTKAGFKLYRFSDDLQATSPVFLRVDYGTGSNVAYPAVWPAVGSAHLSSGALTGQQVSDEVQVSYNQAFLGTRLYCSGDTNRVAIAYSLGNTTSGTSGTIRGFGVERSKAASGADTGEYAYIQWISGTAFGTSQVVNLTANIAPAPRNSFETILARESGTMIWGDTVGFGASYPMRGIPLNPGLNFIFVMPNDYQNMGPILAPRYGATVEYQHLGFSSGIHSIPTAGSARTAIIWE
jgi:hypothetical protein